MTGLAVVRDWLEELGLPGTDISEPTTSAARFADGGWYKWEVAGAFDARSVRRLAEVLEARGERIHQVTNTVGTMRYLDAEIRELVAVTSDLGIQLRMASGPRGVFDLGAQKLAPGIVAAASAYRLRGAEQLSRGVHDILRATELGVRGFLIFDEGLLSVLDALRAAGRLPADLRLKASSNMGASNAAHVRVLAELGADSVNVQRDLEIGMLAALRAATTVALDVHTDNPQQTGGIVRGYDVPEIVRVAAPVYLKTGNAAQDFSDTAPSESEINAIAHQLLLDGQFLHDHLPEATASTEPEF